MLYLNKYKVYPLKKILLLLLLSTITACNKKTTKTTERLQLEKLPKEKLLQDFDLLAKCLKEAHTGLYWYSTEKQFDSIAVSQRKLIKDSLNNLEFYRIAAPLVAYSKEDHCDIHLDTITFKILKQKGRFFPLDVVYLNKSIYILNNPTPGITIKGHELLEVNGVVIQKVYEKIFNTFAADGFIESSKYRYLDLHSFAIEYAKAIGQPESYSIKVKNTKTNKIQQYNLAAVPLKKLSITTDTLYKDGVVKDYDKPATLEFINSNTAVLSINTFSNSDYEDSGLNFKDFTRQSFTQIRNKNIGNLIIDIRENGGGTEGNEDYLFSFLTDKPYTKYKYVEASAFSYSFYKYSDYSSPEDIKELETDLQKEHYLAEDGRILRKQGIQQPEPLQKQPYKGNIYILTSGWTYSGGAEFSSLMKEHTDAVFIGEEVGGGYIGNTSGYSIILTLPNTGISVDIPILKFVLDVSPKVPFGRGVLPDYEISPTIDDFLKGKDTQMEFALNLANKASKQGQPVQHR